MQTQTVQSKHGVRMKRLRAEVRLLRAKPDRLDQALAQLRLLVEERTYRLAGRLARLEGESCAVQCRDGS